MNDKITWVATFVSRKTIFTYLRSFIYTIDFCLSGKSWSLRDEIVSRSAQKFGLNTFFSEDPRILNLINKKK